MFPKECGVEEDVVIGRNKCKSNSGQSCLRGSRVKITDYEAD